MSRRSQRELEPSLRGSTVLPMTRCAATTAGERRRIMYFTYRYYNCISFEQHAGKHAAVAHYIYGSALFFSFTRKVY